MKSLLVDALRAANDDTSSTGADQSAAAEGQRDPEVARPIAPDELTTDELEIVEAGDDGETLFEPDTVPVDDPDAFPADGGAIAGVDIDVDAAAGPRERDRVIEAVVAPHGTAAGDAAHATAVERAARITPLLCLGLACSSALAFSVWSNIADPGRQSGLLARALYGQSAPRSSRAAAAERPESRFALNTAPPVARADETSAAVAGVSSPRAPVTIARAASRAASPAGLTQADGETFATLSAAYRAFLNGEVGHDYIDWLLGHRAVSGGEAAELEIRLLLQQYPDEASLHRALGAALAAAGRVPEAQASLAQARGLEAGGRAGTAR